MNYKIIVDSCGELTEEMKKTGLLETAPLTIQIDNTHIVDDETFDQKDFLRRIAESPNCPKSSCPSPEKYMKSYDCEAERIYVVTLSAELSGSYNSAVLGRNLYREERGEKQIYIFNSRSASVGETLIAMKIMECENDGMGFEDVIETVEAYIAGQHTHFVLESLDTLKKNGRLSGVKALVATALNIKPVMSATDQGIICQRGQARGVKKALVKMVENIMEDVRNPKEKILGIAHCNCPERARSVRDMILEKAEFKDIFIVDTRGISSMYASDGGIIVVV